MKLGDTMTRSLTLLLNGGKSNTMPLDQAISLNLETMDSRDLDDYVSKSFNSSEEIRKKYADQINPFLEKHRNLIEKIESETGRSFQGSIVITELDEKLMLERKRVLYKKDIIVFKEIIKKIRFLLAIVNRDYINWINAQKKGEKYTRLFPEYYGRSFNHYSDNNNQFQRIRGEWLNSVKDNPNYYEFIRRILKEYEGRYKGLGLDSPDVVYSKYLEDKERKKQERQEAKQEAINSKEYENIPLVDSKPDRVPNFADEDGYLGDLEDWNSPKKENDDIIVESNVDDEIVPRFPNDADEPGYTGDLEDWSRNTEEKGKTMTLHNNYSKMFHE